MTEARRRRPASVGQTIGGVLVGFDEQVWRQTPPAQERVEKVDRVRTVSAANGLTIELPTEAPEAGGGPIEPAEAPAGPAAAPSSDAPSHAGRRTGAGEA